MLKKLKKFWRWMFPRSCFGCSVQGTFCQMRKSCPHGDWWNLDE